MLAVGLALLVVGVGGLAGVVLLGLVAGRVFHAVLDDTVLGHAVFSHVVLLDDSVLSGLFGCGCGSSCGCAATAPASTASATWPPGPTTLSSGLDLGLPR